MNAHLVVTAGWRDHTRQEDALYENGADIVVSDLDELILTTRIQNSPRNRQLPDVISREFQI